MDSPTDSGRINRGSSALTATLELRRKKGSIRQVRRTIREFWWEKEGNILFFAPGPFFQKTPNNLRQGRRRRRRATKDSKVCAPLKTWENTKVRLPMKEATCHFSYSVLSIFFEPPLPLSRIFTPLPIWSRSLPRSHILFTGSQVRIRRSPDRSKEYCLPLNAKSDTVSEDE